MPNAIVYYRLLMLANPPLGTYVIGLNQIYTNKNRH